MRIEILMATYNGEKYLNNQIDSILDQDYSGWHLTISDDQSVDATKEIISKYESLYPSMILEHKSGVRFGNAKDHFLYLMDNCESDYMMFSDQDDIWQKNKISRSFERMKTLENQFGENTPILIFSDLVPVDEKLNIIEKSLMSAQDQNPFNINYKNLIFQNVVTGCTVMINKSLRNIASKCCDVQSIIMHDHWLGLVAAKFGVISYIDEGLVQYRQHRENSVGIKRVKHISYYLGIMQNLNDVKTMICRKKKQAECFLKTYENELDEDDIAFLRRFSKQKSGFPFYSSSHRYIHGLHRLIGFIMMG